MNFKEMTLLQLKAYAKEKGIRGVSTLKKNQLIERIIALHIRVVHVVIA